MSGTSTKENVVTIAGLLMLTAFFAVAFALTALSGPAAPIALLAVPIPSFAYLVLVRGWMRSRDDCEDYRPSRGLHLVLSLGLVVIAALSIVVALFGLCVWGTPAWEMLRGVGGSY